MTYEELFELQGGRCAICGKRSPRRRLDQDHDHAVQRLTGEIILRGLLCRRCNRAVGSFEWSSEVLARAAVYLEKIIELRKRYEIA